RSAGRGAISCTLPHAALQAVGREVRDRAKPSGARALGDAIRRYSDVLVGRGERETHVLRRVSPVEVSGRNQDAELRELLGGLPGVDVTGHPEVEAGLTVVDTEAGSLDRGAQHRATSTVEVE